MEVQEEVIAPEEEKEQDESDTGEEVSEGMITLADVEEALLIGIQQLITEVSQINEKDKDPLMERSAEEESPQECATSEDLFAVVVEEERETIESSNKETGEPSEETPSDEKDGNINCEMGLEETTDETITMTNAILWSSQEYERECHQDPTGSD
ncbi:Retrotransposon-like protein 1, partial [Ophiophagus hannah]